MTAPTSRETLLASLLLGGLAVAILAPVALQPRTRILADDAQRPGESEAYGSLWRYWSMQRRLAAWQDPYATDAVFPPDGARFGFDTHALVPTLLTMPLVRAVGPVGAYNGMVLLLLAGAALALHLHLRRTDATPPVIAGLAGAGFGFGPHFLAAAHARPEWIAGAFWGTALAALVHAYTRGAFGATGAVALACGIWACFWTSLPAFSVAVLAVALAVVALEASRAPGARSGAWAKARFFAPLLLGAPSLAFLPRAAAERALEGAGAPVPAAGLVLPAVTAALAVITWGLAWRARQRPRALLATGAASILLGVAALDPAGATRAALRALPEALRPEPAALAGPALFGGFTLLAHGAQLLWRSRTAAARATLATLALVVLWEARPAIHGSPVRRLRSTIAHGRPDPRWRVLVVPRAGYRAVDDTYQVAVDAACVDNAWLRRHATSARALEARWPRVYRDRGRIWDGALGRELRELGVGYLVLEDSAATERLPPELRRAWMSGPDGVLVGLR